MTPTRFVCPVCNWPELESDPNSHSYKICEQCGVEFGYDSPELYPIIRKAWENSGRSHWLTDKDWQKTLNEIEVSGETL